MAAFVIHMILFFSYFSSHPPQPDLQHGLVYPLNNHGSFVYLTRVEAAGLVLLRQASFVGFFVALVVVPKEPILPPRGTLQWVTYLGGAAKTDLENPTKDVTAIFLAAIALWSVLIVSMGNFIATFAVFHGVVLSGW